MDEEGNSMVFDKAYSQKANMEKVMKHVRKNLEGKEIWNYIVLHANNPEAASWYEREMTQLCKIGPASNINISPVIVANAGIGAASIAIMYK